MMRRTLLLPAAMSLLVLGGSAQERRGSGLAIGKDGGRKTGVRSCNRTFPLNTCRNARPAPRGSR